MNAKNILKVKRPLKPQTPPPSNDSAIEEAVEALQKSETETQQQLELVIEKRFLVGLQEMNQFAVLGGVSPSY